MQLRKFGFKKIFPKSTKNKINYNNEAIYRGYWCRGGVRLQAGVFTSSDVSASSDL
jgi:hypothetical protein